MKKNVYAPVLAACIMILSAGAAIADDIVPNSEDLGSIYSDHKAYKAGDIVTVLVVETTEGYQSASLKTDKQSGLSGGMGMSTWGGGTRIAFPGGVPSWGAAGSEYQNGGGKSVRSGGLIAKISARVEKVLSNGNLSIKGTKVIQINDEKQNLVISGTIRPEDISADNTILSMSVADAMIEYEGKGPIGEKTSPGVITRILDWLGIF
jgi:flagellar L-ring protein precursor FlgH